MRVKTVSATVRRLALISLSALVAAAVALPALGRSAQAAVGEIAVYVGGERLALEVPPVVVDDRTFVPMRAILEALGASVEWEPSTQTVTANRQGLVLVLAIGSGTALVDGSCVPLDAPARMVSGRTMVPLRFVGQNLGETVTWDGATQTIEITKTPDVVATGPATHGFHFLSETMDRYSQTLDVYTDLGAAGNHFAARAFMGDVGALTSNEGCQDRPHQGSDCMEWLFTADGPNWAGVYFMNGVLRGTEVTPGPNWGDIPSAGLDLTGATEVTFWARGAEGGERVEFFVGGIGRSTGQPYPESLEKVSTGYVTLSKDWTRYAIDVSGHNTSYMLGGFGWVTAANQNGFRGIKFYLDDISWNKPRPDDPRLLVSYEPRPGETGVAPVLRNVAFTYDNALALLAFLARGTEDDLHRAKLLADALAYTSRHDRYYADGRLRNAYMGGDLVCPPGWTPNDRLGTARLPGFYDIGQKMWFEDELQVSTSTGNVAWVMVALLAAHARFDDPAYLEAARGLGEWVETETRANDALGGYTGGYEGWEPAPAKCGYKSTEHNLDLYVAFERLYEATGDQRWRTATLHARHFVEAMWDIEEGKFWTGTAADGLTINKTVIPLDVQAWAVLAFRTEAGPYAAALDYAQVHHRTDGGAGNGGFDFNTDCDGTWYEGTAQMALAYRALGRHDEANRLTDLVALAQLPSGSIPAASLDGLTTGFDWLYFHQGHVGATAWYLLAACNGNPYWIK